MMKSIIKQSLFVLLGFSILSLSLVAQSLDLQKDSQADVEPSITTINERAPLYGEWLFSGGFSQSSFSGINPNYLISQGDTLLMQIWGGVNFQGEVQVDPQGNIFIPNVGPVKVQGVSNAELNNVILKSVQRIYKANVETYVNLVSTQYVKVFLSGLVKKPGLYEGQSADSILHFIDKAGGIRSDIGGYRQIQLKRANKLIAKIDLYKFLNEGSMPITQLQDGDIIFVGAKKGEVSIEGEVGFEGRYELADEYGSLSDMIEAVVVTEKATHITVVESKGESIDARQYPINQVDGIRVRKGSKLKLSSQQRAKNISIEVLGEHESAQELVLPWGATLADVLQKVTFTPLSNQSGLQLYRQSVAERQKAMLDSSLDTLEKNVLKTESPTHEAALLRKAEAELVLEWVQRARKVQPKGQVLLSGDYDSTKVVLQQGDRIVVPMNKNLVMVHGDVLFPTAIAYDKNMSVSSIIKKAGGIDGKLKHKRILVMSPNGSFNELKGGILRKYKRLSAPVDPGDEIFILPEPQIKSLQLSKDISQVIYQIAISAAAVVGLGS